MYAISVLGILLLQCMTEVELRFNTDEICSTYADWYNNVNCQQPIPLRSVAHPHQTGRIPNLNAQPHFHNPGGRRPRQFDEIEAFKNPDYFGIYIQNLKPNKEIKINVQGNPPEVYVDNSPVSLNERASRAVNFNNMMNYQYKEPITMTNIVEGAEYEYGEPMYH